MAAAPRIHTDTFRFLAVGAGCFGYGPSIPAARNRCNVNGKWAVVVERADWTKPAAFCHIDGPDISGKVVAVHRERNRKRYTIGQLLGSAKVIDPAAENIIQQQNTGGGCPGCCL